MKRIIKIRKEFAMDVCSPDAASPGDMAKWQIGLAGPGVFARSHRRS